MRRSRADRDWEAHEDGPCVDEGEAEQGTTESVSERSRGAPEGGENEQADVDLFVKREDHREDVVL